MADGRVPVGTRVFVKKNSARVGLILDGESVSFEGRILSINAWGMEVTGWPSINIYEAVFVEGSGLSLGSFRDADSNKPD